MDPMRYLLDLIYLILILITGKWRWLRARPETRAFGLPQNGACVWFHGVSVGEIHLLRAVVARFRERHPGVVCIISSTTATGLDEARKSFPDLPIIRWPLDFSGVVERALRELRPDLVVLAEGELWPNFLMAARRQGIPVVAINVRLSPRSFPRYRQFRFAT